jgi:hypothetical protein
MGSKWEADELEIVSETEVLDDPDTISLADLAEAKCSVNR